MLNNRLRVGHGCHKRMGAWHRMVVQTIGREVSAILSSMSREISSKCKRPKKNWRSLSKTIVRILSNCNWKDWNWRGILRTEKMQQLGQRGKELARSSILANRNKQKHNSWRTLVEETNSSPFLTIRYPSATNNQQRNRELILISHLGRVRLAANKYAVSELDLRHLLSNLWKQSLGSKVKINPKFNSLSKRHKELTLYL